MPRMAQCGRATNGHPHCAKDGEVGAIRTEQTSQGRLVEKGLIRQGWRNGLWNPDFGVLSVVAPVPRPGTGAFYFVLEM